MTTYEKPRCYRCHATGDYSIGSALYEEDPLGPIRLVSRGNDVGLVEAAAYEEYGVRVRAHDCPLDVSGRSVEDYEAEIREVEAELATCTRLGEDDGVEWCRGRIAALTMNLRQHPRMRKQ